MTQLTLRDTLISALHLEGCKSAEEREALLQEFTEVVVANTLTDLTTALESSEVEEIQEWLKGSPDDAVALQKRFGSKLDEFLTVFTKNLHDAIREIEHTSK